MLVFISRNLIFFETPKTASSALHNALAPEADMVFTKDPKVRHFSPRRFQKQVLPMLRRHYLDQDPETTALIREPIDWLGSWYRYRRAAAFVDTELSTADISFEEFTKIYLRQDHTPLAHIGRQSQFLKNADNQPPTNLWRFDAIEGYCQFLGEKLDLRITLKIENKSDAADQSISSETKSQLNDFFAKDYALYNAAKY